MGLCISHGALQMHNTLQPQDSAAHAYHSKLSHYISKLQRAWRALVSELPFFQRALAPSSLHMGVHDTYTVLACTTAQRFCMPAARQA